MGNPVIEPKGDAHTVGMEDIIMNQDRLLQIHQASKGGNMNVTESMNTTGVNELRAMPNPTPSVDLDKVASNASAILNKYDKLMHVSKDDDKGSTNYPSGSKAPKEKYDYNVDADIEKRTKDNIRDESKIERPYDFGNRL